MQFILSESVTLWAQTHIVRLLQIHKGFWDTGVVCTESQVRSENDPMDYMKKPEANNPL